MSNRLSSMARDLVGSEIIRIAADVREMISRGRGVCNLTVGDFDSSMFPIPTLLRTNIIDALVAGQTNYPPSDGMPRLRIAVADSAQREIGLRVSSESVVITSGSRPGIFAAYSAVVDPGDIVVYPVPSWNNNHYTHLVRGRGIPVVCDASTEFLPTRPALEEAVRGARLLVLNSPLNPAGTMFSREALADICDLVLEENARRGPNTRPLYLLYDQVYRSLTSGTAEHYHPCSVRPAMADYTITVDGISKAFAATGLRVGWIYGPVDIVERMSAIVAHVGAWAPRAEQIGTAALLGSVDEVTEYHGAMNAGLRARLDALYDAILRLRGRGFPVDAIHPTGAIYLSARFALTGSVSAGHHLDDDEAIRTFLLESAGIAVVPFSAFGMEADTGWFRLSVGAVSIDQIDAAMKRLERALESLSLEARSGSRSPARHSRRTRQAVRQRSRVRRK